MKLSENLPAIGVIAFLIIGVGMIVFRASSPSVNSVVVDVKTPELSPQALAGKKAFDAYCAQCHGKNGGGSDQGPPLVHNTYNPGHHADQAFFLAAKRGVKRHHWNFEDMPPQPQVKDKEVASIVLYIRELQAANGIFFKKHRM